MQDMTYCRDTRGVLLTIFRPCALSLFFAGDDPDKYQYAYALVLGFLGGRGDTECTFVGQRWWSFGLVKMRRREPAIHKPLAEQHGC